MQTPTKTLLSTHQQQLRCRAALLLEMMTWSNLSNFCLWRRHGGGWRRRRGVAADGGGACWAWVEFCNCSHQQPWLHSWKKNADSFRIEWWPVTNSNQVWFLNYYDIYKAVSFSLNFRYHIVVIWFIGLKLYSLTTWHFKFTKSIGVQCLFVFTTINQMIVLYCWVNKQWGVHR